MAVEIKGGQRATNRPKKLFVQTFGMEGTGKTALALSAPPPLYIVNMDRNMDDLLEKLPEHYTVHYEEVPYDVDMNRGIAAQVIMTVKRMFNDCLKNEGGTFIMDGADLYWEYVKVAKLPDDAEVPNQWGPANTEMENFFRRCESAPFHVFFNSIASNVWAGMNQETQKMKADGFKHAGRFINTKVYMFSPEDHSTPQARPAETPNPGMSFSGFISTAKLNPKIVGSVFPNPSFKALYRAIFGELPPDHEKLWTPS